MTALDFSMRLTRLIEDGTIDKDAEVFVTTYGLYGTLSPIIALDPVNRDVSKAQIVPSVALAFGRLI